MATGSSGTTNFYFQNTQETCAIGYGTTLYSSGNCDSGGLVSFEMKKAHNQIHPQLYFTFIKSKFKIIERTRLRHRLDKLEKAFDNAMKSGQIALAEKFLRENIASAREAAMAAKGLKYFVEREDVWKHKSNIRDGHISDTQLKDYTRIIPEKVLEKKKVVEALFDGFVILHYWNEGAPDVKKMSDHEKAKMRDPILFGLIRETDRWYYIADWQDEFCDLTFDELTKVVAKAKI